MISNSSKIRTALSSPRAIAVAGASELEGGNYYGARVLANLVQGGARAQIYPVNPRLAGTRLHELPVYSSLSDLPTTPDLVFVVTPTKFVIPTLEEAAGMGVATAVVVTAESGNEDERRIFRERVAQIARSSGMRIIGPNSMGVMNGMLSLNGSFASGTANGRVPPGSIACLSQSGATLSAMLQWFGDSSVGFSWMISTGDESATGIEPLMEAMVDDPEVRSIMLFLEGVSDGAAFRRAALGARIAGKPVTMLQVGKSGKGREAVASHTGRVAGTREVFSGLARETGIIETEGFVEFFATARTLSQRPTRRNNLPRNRRAALLSVSGGAASLGADQIYSMGWELPGFSAVTTAALMEATGQPGVHNPADLGGVWRNPDKMTKAITTIAKDEGTDTIFISMGAGGVFAQAVAEAIVRGADAVTQDVFVAWVGMTDVVHKTFDRASVPAFHDLPLAVAAAEACAKFSQNQRDVAQAAELIDVLAQAPAAAPRTAGGSGHWTVTEALSDLKEAGLPCAAFDVVASLDSGEIGAAASRIGFPVVLKLSSPDLNHKSDEGGVAVGLKDMKAVEAAAAAFEDIAHRLRLNHVRVLVQKMERGIELLVGIKRDPSFGLVLVTGLGGTLAELHSEVAATVLPTTRAMLSDLLSRNNRVNALLDGYRGQLGANREALLSFLEAFARWAEEKGEALQEVDLNPVMVSGDHISIVDARVVWN
ncbi:acetyltransferase [Neorhizobium galegae]|uniref:acetate--CoA ligase family protein n=1 Tax=Neorhizobium TaxID=1525371 RepID=UPI0005603B78|nr:MULTISPECIES: acetate--CoA ligase family protein [Neorhizobium]MBP2562299.1 acetyltransferase [Neorhizobium galegae]MDQ0138339.1 acetyltransferase [Neorhizobium galegae]